MAAAHLEAAELRRRAEVAEADAAILRSAGLATEGDVASEARLLGRLMPTLLLFHS